MCARVLGRASRASLGVRNALGAEVLRHPLAERAVLGRVVVLLLGAEGRKAHRRDLEELGEDLNGYDLIIALSPVAEKIARETTMNNAVDVEFWDIADPTALGETRDEKLNAYRNVRDELIVRIKTRFPLQAD